MKLKERFHHYWPKMKIALGALVVAGVAGVGFYFVGRPLFVEVKSSDVAQGFKEKGIRKTYVDYYNSFVHKVEELDQALQINEELTKKVLLLEKELETQRSLQAEAESKKLTSELTLKLKQEAGSELARVLGAIDYSPPVHLLPHQLYSLGLGYFRKEEYEKSAVIFTHLIELKEDRSYHRPEVRLLSGMSWYHLKHYKLAQKYIDTALEVSVEDSALQRKLLVWKSLVLDAQGLRMDAQAVLTQLISKYPHSEEAAWVNRTNAAPRIKDAAKESAELEREPAHAPEAEQGSSESNHHEINHHGSDHHEE